MTADALPRQAVKGIFWGQWTYWCTLVLAVWSYRYSPPGSIRTVLVLTPVLPALLIVAVAYWVYEDVDEYIRLRILRSAALTAVIVAFGTLTCFILELFGRPPVSALWVNLVGWSVFNVQMVYVLFRSR